MMKQQYYYARWGAGILAIVVAITAIYVVISYEQALLSALHHHRIQLQIWVGAHPWMGGACYLLLFTLVIGLYIPGGVMLLLLAGAVFPWWQALIWANIGNLSGALLGFWLARHWLRDRVQSRYGARLARVNAAIDADGWLYLLVLRIAPVLPAPLVNAGMGISPMHWHVYAVVTLLGRIPMTAFYVTLGAKLGEIDHVQEIWSPSVFALSIAFASIILVGHGVLRALRPRCMGH